MMAEPARLRLTRHGWALPEIAASLPALGLLSFRYSLLRAAHLRQGTGCDGAGGGREAFCEREHNKWNRPAATELLEGTLAKVREQLSD